MRFRRLLTVLDGEETDRALMDQGLVLARALGGQLDALFVRRNAASGGDFIGDPFPAYGMEAVLDSLDEAAAEASRRARDAFDSAIEGVEDDCVGRFVEFVGLPRQAMALEGRLSDLIITHKPEDAQRRAQLNMIETLAFEAGRPVLVLPRAEIPVSRFDRVVIAWDGSLEAMRAVVGAMPWLQSAGSVIALHIGADSQSQDQMADLARYLNSHDVSVDAQALERDRRSVARTLIESALNIEADLLVMGGFGAPGWQRSLGRDETTALLRDTPFAILLAH